MFRVGYVEHEPEGTFRVRAMLKGDRSAEGEIAKKLRATIRLANEAGDAGMEHLLREILLNLEDQSHHLDHFLGGDSLGLGLEP